MEVSTTIYLEQDTKIKGEVLGGGKEANYDKAYLEIKSGETALTFFFNFEPSYSWTEERQMFADFASQMSQAIKNVWDARHAEHIRRAEELAEEIKDEQTQGGTDEVDATGDAG